MFVLVTSTERAASGEPRPRAVSPGRPPKSTVAARLRHILTVASAEFVSRGYAEASVSRIARDAGVSKKTIYARYPSKEALLLAVTGDVAARLHETVVAVMADADGDPEHTLTSFGTEVARNWAAAVEVGLYRLIISEAVRFPELASIYRDTMARFRATLAAYLREQTDLGKLAVDDPDAAAYQFGMLAFGGIREKALLGETVTDADVATAVRRAVEVFLHGYAVSSRAR